MSRLIDADALKELLYYDKATCAVIDEVPTIDPVKHGKWIYQIMPVTGAVETICSECNTPFYMAFRMQMNYCPYCGAKVEEKK